MKTTFRLLVLSLFLPLNINAQWYWQNPLPQGNDIYDAIMLSQDTLIACAAKQTIMWTGNGGESWEVSYLPGTDTLLEVGFFDKTYGLALPLNGSVYITSDAGRSWSKTSLTTFYVPISHNAISMLDDQSCYILICYSLINDIYYTNDRGQSWSSIPSPYWGFPHEISFSDQQNGCLINREYDPTYEQYFYKLYATSNGGNIWDLIIGLGGMYTAGLSNLFMASPDTGYIQFGGNLLKTTDSWSSWDIVYDDYISYLQGIDQDQLWIRHYEYQAHQTKYTNNGGNSWTDIYTPCGEFFFKDLQKGISWENYNIYSTNDTGNNWSQLFEDPVTTDRINDVFFLDDSIGWAWGDKFILKTSNGGSDWHLKYTSTNDINKIQFINNEFGYMTYDDNTDYIYKTYDGGATWQTTWARCEDFFGFSEDTLWRCHDGWHNGIRYFLRATFDGGSTWEFFGAWMDEELIGVFFIDELNAFAISEYSIYKTTDGWQTYIVQYANNQYPLVKLQFVDINKGIVYNHGDTYYLDSNGSSWHKVIPPISWSTYQRDVQLMNDGTIYIARDIYPVGLYMTADGGLNWTRYDVRVARPKGIHFLENGNGWVVGEDGAIVHNQDVITEVQENPQLSHELPGITLYPNPVKDKLNIKCAEWLHGDIIINIFSINGSLIHHKNIYRNKTANHPITMNLTGLTKGIYIVRLITVNHSESSKIIIR